MSQKEFNWEEAQFDHFILQIAYDGTQFHGLAWQPPVKKHLTHTRNLKDVTPTQEIEPHEIVPIPTIENEIVSSLEKSKLIISRESCNLSRCGRTDLGVHARKNYLSLRLRLKKSGEEYDYVKILNGMLPKSIRVLCAKRVPLWFDARFHCLYRSYKYFFRKNGLDLEAMDRASRRFMGLHNFQNFCKTEPDTNRSYTRQILHCRVSEGCSAPIGIDVGIFEVVSPAFLWHQVRCMMGALFLVGNGKGPESMISDWLDCPEKTYDCPLAPADGLILWDCFFDPVLEGDPIFPRSESQDSFREMRSEALFRSVILGALAGE